MIRLRRQFENNCLLFWFVLISSIFGLQFVQSKNVNTEHINQITGRSDDVLNVIYGAFEKCADGDFFVCLKENAVRFIDSIPGNYEIVEGVELQRTSSSNSVPATATDDTVTVGGITATTTDNISHSRSLDAIDKLPETEREQAVDNLLIERVARFLSTYTLQFKVPQFAIGEIKRSLQEEERRRKKKKFILPLLLLFKMKAAMLIPVVLGALALLAFKALIMGKIALLISGLIALKKLVQHEPHSQTYEVVAHPHHSYSSTYDDHGHYGRSFDSSTNLNADNTDAQTIAYRSQIPEQT